MLQLAMVAAQRRGPSVLSVLVSMGPLLEAEWCLEPLSVGTQPNNLVGVDGDQRGLRAGASLISEWHWEHSLDREQY